jgi:hypothetical protein
MQGMTRFVVQISPPAQGGWFFWKAHALYGDFIADGRYRENSGVEVSHFIRTPELPKSTVIRYVHLTLVSGSDLAIYRVSDTKALVQMARRKSRKGWAR